MMLKESSSMISFMQTWALDLRDNAFCNSGLGSG